MKTAITVAVASLMAGSVLAQTPSRPTPGAVSSTTSNAPASGVDPAPGAAPSAGVANRNTGTAAGDSNQAVATTSANAPQPARGRNSFSQGEARRRIESRGFQQVSGLHKDNNGVWRGSATRDGASVPVWLDYKGNVGSAAAKP